MAKMAVGWLHQRFSILQYDLVGRMGHAGGTNPDVAREADLHLTESGIRMKVCILHLVEPIREV